MAVDIGAEAILRATSGTTSGNTYTNKDNPATIADLITSIDIWARSDIAGLIVGSFYTTNGNTLKCRASQAIEGTIIAGSKVTKEVNIAVEIGDYFGCYFASGFIEYDTGGGAGIWWKTGEYLDPADEGEYTFIADRVMSLGGYMELPGGYSRQLQVPRRARA